MKRLSMALVAAASIAAAAPAMAQVNARQATQQQRVNQGVATGALTRHEAAKDQHHLNHITRRAEAERSRHGGRLTVGERRRLNNRLDTNSQRIEETKHNDRTH